MSTSVHIPPIGPGEPAPCHPGRLLSGTEARCWCRQCGTEYQNRPGEVVIGGLVGEGKTSAADLIAAEEELVARRERIRARELELERATHVPEYRP